MKRGRSDRPTSEVMALRFLSSRVSLSDSLLPLIVQPTDVQGHVSRSTSQVSSKAMLVSRALCVSDSARVTHTAAQGTVNVNTADTAFNDV